jgi:uncharacterized protein
LPESPVTIDLTFTLRRFVCLAAVGLGALAGCAQSPPVRLYHLPSGAPQALSTVAAAVAAAPSAGVWQLLLPVRVPDYLDRESILLPQGATGLLALSGHRWAESLRDAVPRVLRQDLATLLGESRVWAGSLPAGVTVTRQLRVELVAFETTADRAGVQVQARWTLVDPQGQTPPRSGILSERAASANGEIDSLVAAHRQVLWQLAQRLAALG